MNPNQNQIHNEVEQATLEQEIVQDFEVRIQSEKTPGISYLNRWTPKNGWWCECYSFKFSRKMHTPKEEAEKNPEGIRTMYNKAPCKHMSKAIAAKKATQW